MQFIMIEDEIEDFSKLIDEHQLVMACGSMMKIAPIDQGEFQFGTLALI